MKFGSLFKNLFGIECTKHYSDSFRFDTAVARCLGDLFFLSDTVYNYQTRAMRRETLDRRRVLQLPA